MRARHLVKVVTKLYHKDRALAFKDIWDNLLSELDAKLDDKKPNQRAPEYKAESKLPFIPNESELDQGKIQTVLIIPENFGQSCESLRARGRSYTRLDCRFCLWFRVALSCT